MEKTYQIEIDQIDAINIIILLEQQIKEFEAIIIRCDDISLTEYFNNRVKDLKKTLERIKGNVYR